MESWTFLLVVFTRLKKFDTPNPCISDHVDSNGACFITPAMEAFALLMIENNYKKWKSMITNTYKKRVISQCSTFVLNILMHKKDQNPGLRVHLSRPTPRIRDQVDKSKQWSIKASRYFDGRFEQIYQLSWQMHKRSWSLSLVLNWQGLCAWITAETL